MKTLKVPDMHCPKCVQRITKALADEGISCTVNLENKTVDVDENRLAAALEALDDIGFSAQD